jgi:hypothetical protein
MTRFATGMRVLAVVGCVFRPKPITNSGASRSPIPAEADH